MMAKIVEIFWDSPDDFMRKEALRHEALALVEYQQRQAVARIAHKRFKCGPFVWFVNDTGRVLRIH